MTGKLTAHIKNLYFLLQKETEFVYPNASFKEYLFANKTNKVTLIVIAAIITVQFGVFKYFYPFASFIHGDSFNYLETAAYNLDVNTYLVGYARFLRLFSVFTKSDTALVAFQYLFLQASSLFLLYTIFYFYKPSKITQFILLAFIVPNPLLLHLGNLVSSDGFFLALSLTWFTLLLWIMYSPSLKLIFWHALVLFVCFTVRYNAFIFPLIAALSFWFSRQSFKRKLFALFLCVITVCLFVQYNGNKYKKLTGTWQYSPFAGWQWANNAMYAYRYVDKSSRKPVPARFRKLDNMIRQYFDSTRDIKKNPQESWMASTAYMWSPSLPLQRYMYLKFPNDTGDADKKKWPSMGPFYGDYGKWIIKQYPYEFARYFLWPNANKYYAPPVEFLEYYNTAKNTVPAIAQLWFDYPNANVRTRTKTGRVSSLDFYPILSGVINIAMLCSLLCFIILGGFRSRSLFRNAILLGGSLWIVNAGFTIFSSSAALRFQSFPIILTSVFVILLFDWMLKLRGELDTTTVNAGPVALVPVNNLTH